MKLKKIIIGAIVPLILASCGGKQNSLDVAPKEFPAMKVKAEDASLELKYPTTIKGAQDIEIRPRVDGFIKEIYVDEGSVVRKGQALFKIDSPQSLQVYTSAKAGVTSAEAALSTAHLNVDRMRPLAQKGIIGEVQLKIYEDALKNAKAGLDQSKAGLDNASATLSWTTVTSPVDGVVGAVPFRKGSLVNSANVLTSVADTHNVFAYFVMNEKDFISLLGRIEGSTQAEKIKNLPVLTLVLSNGSTYAETGKIETITGIVNPGTGTVTLRAEFPNKQGLLHSGFSGRVIMPIVEKNVFIVPQVATFAQQDKVLVYKVQADSVVQAIVSVLPMPDGKSYAITKGLNDGEIIVSDNLATINPRMKIKANVQ